MKHQKAADLAEPVIRTAVPPLRYHTIVADPPWPYKTPGGGPLQSSPAHRPRMWERHRAGEQVMFGSNHRNHYGSLSLDAIKALPVTQIAEDDAHLYLWTTNGFIVQAHEVAEAWGFRPVTVLTWTKVKPGTAEPSMKTGYYFRGATEHVLFCVRGSLRLTAKRGVSTAFLHPRTPHSVKPDAFFALVEECSPGPYLEMFARRVRPGWSVFGDEVSESIDLGGATVERTG